MTKHPEPKPPLFHKKISAFLFGFHQGRVICARRWYTPSCVSADVEFPSVWDRYCRPVGIFNQMDRDSLAAFIDTELPRFAYVDDESDVEFFRPVEIGISQKSWAYMPFVLASWHPGNKGSIHLWHPQKEVPGSTLTLSRSYTTREWIDLAYDLIQNCGLSEVFWGEPEETPFAPSEDREPPEFPLVKPAATLKKQPGKTFQDRLWNAGYYRYLRSRDAARIFAEAKASDPEALRLPAVGREYFADSEELAEGGLEPFFQLAWDFLKLQKVKPPLMSSLTPPEFEHGGPDEEAASAWALNFLNKRLAQVGSPERAYAVNDGNDLNIVFLTPAQFRLIRAHPDYDPIGDPHPL